MLTIAALMLAAAQAQAQAPAQPEPGWRPLGVVRERYALSWDTASVVRGPEVVSVRIRTQAAQSPQTSPSAVSQVEIRCATSMVRVVETVTYAADGSETRRDTQPAPFDTIPPGSHVAAVQRAVC